MRVDRVIEVPYILAVDSSGILQKHVLCVEMDST